MPSFIDYAALSAHIYNDQRGGAGAITDVNKLDVPQGWTSLKQLGFTGDNLNTNPFSFTAGAYINASGEIVIAYKGTDFLTAYEGRAWNTAADLLADIGLATTIKNFNIGQQLYASSYFLAVKDWAVKNGHAASPISFTGHSLGGGLASNMAVWFNRPATTFAQGPFELGAVDELAIIAAAATLTLHAGVTASQAILEEILILKGAYNNFSAREAGVTNYYVQGEFLSYLRAFIPTVVGSGNDHVIDIGDQPVNRALDLHAMNLHLALLMDDRLKVACKDIPELIPTLIDKTLYAADPNFSVQDFVTRLVADQLRGDISRQDGLLGKFVVDVQKLKGDAGVAMQPKVRTALLAVAIEYYKQKENSDATKIFTVSGGTINFKYSDIGATSYKSLPLLAKAVKELLSTAEKPYADQLIKQNAWHIQQGTDPMNWTADGTAQNDAAIGGTGVDVMDGGAGIDMLIGGAAGDVLTGGTGNDILMGGLGDDIYLFKSGDGSDLIVDTDGLGRIKYDGLLLAGGNAVGTTGKAWQEKNGGKTFNYLLTDWTENGETFKRLSIQGPDGGMIIKRWEPGQLGITFKEAQAVKEDRTILGDLAPIEGASAGSDDLGNPLTNGSAAGRKDYLRDGAGNDLIRGLGGDDQILALRGGDDQIYGGTGNDEISGGDGNDQIYGEEDNDSLGGGEGNDLLDGGIGDDILYGENGDDILQTGGGRDRAFGGLGSDILIASDVPGQEVANVYLDGNAGNDSLIGAAGSDLLLGGRGEDYLVGGAGNDFLFGDTSTKYTSLVHGDWSVSVSESGVFSIYHWKYDITDGTMVSSADDSGYFSTVNGVGEDDVLDGGSGDDWLLGGGGDDRLYGGDGKDVMFAGRGADFLDGEAGDDRVVGNGGDDILYGGEGNDSLSGDGDSSPADQDGRDQSKGSASHSFQCH